jgi:hypothetical protein
MKTANELNITEQQRVNLAKVAVGLRDLKPNGYKGQFNMKVFCAYGDSSISSPPILVKKVFHNCGTCGCVLGHAPLFGIEARDCESWVAYAKRSFGGGWGDTEDQMWLFSPMWPSNKKMAIKRIAWVMERGWPKRPLDFTLEHDGYTLPKGYRSFRPNWEDIEELAQSSN